MKMSIHRKVPREMVIASIIKVLFKDYSKLHWLDLGTGNGLFSRKIVGFIEEKGQCSIEGLAIDVGDSLSDLPARFKFVRDDIFNVIENLPPHYYQIISLFEVIEHFEKAQALALINTLKAKGSVLIISTPSGFLRQDASTHSQHENNPYQWHRCGFTAEELEQMGFFVIISKSYHQRPIGNNRNFDSLIAIYGCNVIDLLRIRRRIRRVQIEYFTNPLHLYRALRLRILRICKVLLGR